MHFLAASQPHNALAICAGTGQLAAQYLVQICHLHSSPWGEPQLSWWACLDLQLLFSRPCSPEIEVWMKLFPCPIPFPCPVLPPRAFPLPRKAPPLANSTRSGLLAASAGMPGVLVLAQHFFGWCRFALQHACGSLGLMHVRQLNELLGSHPQWGTHVIALLLHLITPHLFAECSQEENICIREGIGVEVRACLTLSLPCFSLGISSSSSSLFSLMQIPSLHLTAMHFWVCPSAFLTQFSHLLRYNQVSGLFTLCPSSFSGFLCFCASLQLRPSSLKRLNFLLPMELFQRPPRRTPMISKGNVIFLQEALIYKANSQRFRQVYHTAINVWMHNGMQGLISVMCLDDALLIRNHRWWSQRGKLKHILLKLGPSNTLLRIPDKRRSKCHTI